ncbi:hypothetical protein N7468_003077 [Penicillium chermesinum]|uniref:Uncharacterized protein n=1 Tax=Penicillium chermesinum TaxID=63820 RepID=A0A9W9P5S4_9EURO|nr:uncharacterized protein N7468_003077 [Penicillium chermesinum]KAJ5238458.1 hypothetical protein N7468_003077 [Penicillium chermesinum]KAJ6164116.1 hypothetical protein N7470_002788 [Penicillium chermesinum]
MFKIPEHVSHEAAVIPTGISTASYELFEHTVLGCVYLLHNPEATSMLKDCWLSKAEVRALGAMPPSWPSLLAQNAKYHWRHLNQQTSLGACMEILARTESSKLTAGIDMKGVFSLSTNLVLLANMPYMLYFNEDLTQGFTSGSKVGPANYNDFFSRGTSSRHICSFTKMYVVDKGLESTQEACDILRAKVSNKKF